MKKLLNSATRFLTVSLALILLLTVCIFSFLAFFMSRKSGETISAVGTTYMTGMGEKVTQHFATTIELRLSQVDSLVGSIPPDSASPSSLRAELARNAKARDFAALAFYSPTGAFDMIYGDEPVLADPDSFLVSMNNGDKKVAVASIATGQKDVLLGVSAEYLMADGTTSTALVASLPADYIADTLSLYSENSLVYSHIIRRDGSFVIRSGDAFRENYFNRIQALFEEQGESGEQYIRELEAAMDKGEDYSTLMVFGSERRHLQCNKLPLLRVVPGDGAALRRAGPGCQRPQSRLAVPGFPGLRRGAAGPAAGVLAVFPASPGADGGAGGRPEGGRPRQQSQERIPLQHVPRHPDPHERHCGHDRHRHRQH